jgi:hypothetical protein
MTPNRALAAIHEAAIAAGRNPMELTPVTTIGGDPKPAEPLHIPPADWEAERIAMLTAERAERERQLAAETARLEPEPGEGEPPTRPRRRGWRREPA